MEIIQHIGCFTYEVQETKMLTYLINKQVPVKEPVLQDALIFLVEAYLKLVLDYSSEVDYCEVDFCNVCVELCQISAEVEVILE